MSLILRWLAPYLMKGAAIVGLLIAAWFYIGHVERSARAAQKAQDAAAVQKATLQAELAATRLARLKEARSAANTKDANDRLVTEMANGTRSLDAYLMRLKADTRRAGPACMPTTADAADIIDRADRDSVLESDLRTCEVNTARLINARDWALKEFPQ